MAIKWLPLIIFGVLLNSCAQILLKYGANTIKGIELTSGNIGALGMSLLTSWHIWVGLTLYGISVVNWVIVLRSVPVSVAYPTLSLGFIITAVYASLQMQERVGPWQIVGICLIVTGVFFLFYHLES